MLTTVNDHCLFTFDLTYYEFYDQNLFEQIQNTKMCLCMQPKLFLFIYLFTHLFSNDLAETFCYGVCCEELSSFNVSSTKHLY